MKKLRAFKPVFVHNTYNKIKELNHIVSLVEKYFITNTIYIQCQNIYSLFSFLYKLNLFKKITLYDSTVGILNHYL